VQRYTGHLRLQVDTEIDSVIDIGVLHAGLCYTISKHLGIQQVDTNTLLE